MVNTYHHQPEDIVSINIKGETGFGVRKGSLRQHPVIATSSEAQTHGETYSYHKSRHGISVNSPILSMSHYP